MTGWCGRRRVAGSWKGRIGGFAGCILVGGVVGSIGPWWPEGRMVCNSRQLRSGREGGNCTDLV